MLAKRIIPCLDVKQGQVVKGVKFRDHRIVGDIINLAQAYSIAGADELVFYDITASSDQRVVDRSWISNVAKVINIPFCVAGGIRTLQDAEAVLHAGADKFSINSPALENPQFIDQCVATFGQQCVVIGIDSLKHEGEYCVCQYTGDIAKTKQTHHSTATWIKEVQCRGAGEIVLNCMNNDGVKTGYDITQLKQMRKITHVPLIASGGAGQPEHFCNVFKYAHVDGALAASIFHDELIEITALKLFLTQQNIEIRL